MLTLFLSVELGAQVSKEKFPLFFEYLEVMKQDEAVKKSILPVESHIAILNAFKTGVHDYSHTDLQGTGVTIYSRED